MEKQKIFEQIRGGLIVSCQALEHEPLYTKEGGIMPLMAKAAAQSGAAGTGSRRPDGSSAPEFIRAVKEKYPQQLVMADCATLEEGIACAEAGADFVGTTMRGYTPETKGCDDIDYAFIHELSEKCPAKIIAEGHIHYPEQAKKALEAGAFALVVGGAITRPAEITSRFVSAIRK